jgi:hypothetical protein
LLQAACPHVRHRCLSRRRHCQSPVQGATAVVSGGRRPLLQGRPLLARLAFAPGQPRRLCCRCSLQTSTKGRKPPPWQRARAPPQSQLFADGQRRLCLLYAAPGSPGPAGGLGGRQSTLLRSDNSHSDTIKTCCAPLEYAEICRGRAFFWCVVPPSPTSTPRVRGGARAQAPPLRILCGAGVV